MRPGLWIPTIWFVPRLTSSEYLLTIWSSQQLIRRLETNISTLQADLGARESEITTLKLSLEHATRISSRQQIELTLTKQTAEAQVEAQVAEIAALQRRLTQAAAHAKTQKSTIEQLKKAVNVRIHSAFCSKQDTDIVGAGF